ncbi:MAG: MFS transporter, partial [Thermoplasmatota archaeon]
MFDITEKYKLSKKYKWVISLILVLSVVIGYFGRMSVSVALPNISQDFDWSSAQEGNLGGVLMGIFLISYGFSNVFLSKYIDKYGSKIILVVSITTWSSALVIGARFGYIYWVFLLSRLLLGLGQGVLYPVASKVTAQWFPPHERGRANSFYMSGGPLGVMFAPLIMRPIIESVSWEFSFYTLAILGTALLLPVILFLGSPPFEKYDRKEERDVNKQNDMFEILKERNFQLLMVGFSTMTSIWWGLTFWIPTYLVKTQGLRLEEMAYGATFIYFGALLAMIIGSWISDITGKRRRIILFSLFATSLMILFLTNFNIGSSFVALIVLFIVFFTGQMAPPLFFTLLQSRVDNKYIGSATGVMNGIGNGISVIGPVSVGFVIALTSSYNYGMMSLAVIGIS